MDNNYNNGQNDYQNNTQDQYNQAPSDPYGQPGGYDPYNTTPVPQSNGMAVGSLVLGILSIVGCCFWYVAVVLAIIGLILGVMAKKKNPSGMATAGIILSAIDLVISIALGILVLVKGEDLMEWANQMQEQANQNK